MVPTTIIVHTALGRATESASDTVSPTPAHGSVPEDSMVWGNSLVSHHRLDNQRLTSEEHRLEIRQERAREPDHEPSPDLMRCSDPDCTADSLPAMNQPFSMDSSSSTAAQLGRGYRLSHVLPSISGLARMETCSRRSAMMSSSGRAPKVQNWGYPLILPLPI